MNHFADQVKKFHLLCDEKRPSEAIDILEKMPEMARSVAEIINLGFCYTRIGEFKKAEYLLDLAWPDLPPKEPETIAVAFELATVKFHLEKIDEGAALQKLVMSADWYQPSFKIPLKEREEFSRILKNKLLTDDQSIAGKKIFVVWVGGAGDVIEQARNIENLIAEGAHAVLADPPDSLKRLFLNSSLPVTLEQATIENIDSCDAIAFANILQWRYSRSALPECPRRGYMKPVPQKAVRIRISGPQGKTKVGIVWKSINTTMQSCRHEPFRSMDLSTLAPLLARDEIQFYSLQYGDYNDHEKALLAHFHVIDVSPYIRTFTDVAEVMMQLDLVISIDSAPAHLAGALDVPVWNLLSQIADWRWGPPGRRTTPLYPSMKLFRQLALGDWSTVVAEMTSELGEPTERA